MSQSKAASFGSAYFISNTGVPIMQQLIQQLTHASVHSADYPRGVANRRRRLALSHIECTAPIFDRVPEQSRGRAMSNQAIMLTTILGLFGLALMALALYQWTLILQQQIDIERVRRESADGGLAVPSNGLASSVSSSPLTPESAVEIERQRRISAYLSDVKPLVLMWRDAQARAEASDGTTATGALSTLREVISRTSAVVPPAEAQDVHHRLLACMRRVVEEYETASRDIVAGEAATPSREAREEFDSVAVEFAKLDTETLGHSDRAQ